MDLNLATYRLTPKRLKSCKQIMLFSALMRLKLEEVWVWRLTNNYQHMWKFELPLPSSSPTCNLFFFLLV
jgi:hypothetical protein